MRDEPQDLAVGTRVRIYPGTEREALGHIVDDFGEAAGHGVEIGQTRVADPARRWAVVLDAGAVVFVDSHQLGAAPS